MLLEKQTSWFLTNDNFHLSKIPDLVHKVLHNKNNDITYNQKRSLKHYTDNSRHINRALYNDKVVKSHESVKRHLDALTSRKCEHDHHVYSGLSPKGSEQCEKEGIVHLKGYTSTSVSKKVAKSFSNVYNSSHILHIHVKKDDKIHHIHPNHTWTPHEFEAILPRNTKLNIHKTEIVKDSIGKEYKIHHATIHSQEE